jgi:hypothetical protein
MGPTEGVTERDVKLALKQFIGEISQKPPRYSTTKVDGREFYRMALAGEEVPYKLKRMTVDGIEVLSFGEGPTAEALLAEHPSISADATGFPKLKQMELRIAQPRARPRRFAGQRRMRAFHRPRAGRAVPDGKRAVV